MTTKMRPLLLSLVWLCGYRSTTANIFNSAARIKALVDHGEWLIQRFERQSPLLIENSDKIQHYKVLLAEWTAGMPAPETTEGDMSRTELVAHPVNAFNIIRDWTVLVNLFGGVESPAVKFVQDEIEANKKSVFLPCDVDYVGALQALGRLQVTYHLPVELLSAGVVYNRTARRPLIPDDWYEMGIMFMEVDHKLALSWFQFILDTGDYSHERKLNIYKELMKIYKLAGDYSRALDVADQIWNKDFTDPQNAEIIKDINLIQDQISSTGDSIGEFWQMERDANYSPNKDSLCRGENIRNSILVTKELRCVYRKGRLPYVQYKEEIHSFSPRISLIIDIITDRQAESLRQMAYVKLEESRIGIAAVSGVTSIRTSKLSWLYDEDHSIVDTLSQKVADITGLSTEFKSIYAHAEPFQVLNYGLGGQYEPHYDFFLEDVNDEARAGIPDMFRYSGERITTFLFYLNDVIAGGATVYPRINVRVPPIKNAAALWHNYNLNAERDLNTLHAGCPVLLGQKWAANKWFREEGNIFNRPCPIQKDQVDPIWYK